MIFRFASINSDSHSHLTDPFTDVVLPRLSSDVDITNVPVSVNFGNAARDSQDRANEGHDEDDLETVILEEPVCVSNSLSTINEPVRGQETV